MQLTQRLAAVGAEPMDSGPFTAGGWQAPAGQCSPKASPVRTPPSSCRPPFPHIGGGGGGSEGGGWVGLWGGPLPAGDPELLDAELVSKTLDGPSPPSALQ